MPAFKDEVRSRAKNPEHRREKFSSNSLFEKTSKLDRTVKDLTRDNTKGRVPNKKTTKVRTYVQTVGRLGIFEPYFFKKKSLDINFHGR